MIIYNGGSKDEYKDEKLKSITDNSDLSTPIKTSENNWETGGNQIFIEFTSHGGSKKNFSANITFGIEQNHKLYFCIPFHLPLNQLFWAKASLIIQILCI